MDDRFFGAKILGGDEPGRVPRPQTSRIVTLRSTQLNVSALLDEDNTVVAYQFTLSDLSDHTTYVYRYDDDIRNMLEEFFAKCPRLGETAAEEEDPDEE